MIAEVRFVGDGFGGGLQDFSSLLSAVNGRFYFTYLYKISHF